MEILENDLSKNNLSISEEVSNNQTNFLQTTIGRTINAGLDIGLRALLPDLIENQVIDVKNTILEEGFSEGIQKLVSSVVDFGKSALGIITGNFENISQVQTVVKNGGIIDSTSNLIDYVINKTNSSGLISSGIANTIKKGKNVILNSISSKIENEFNEQLASANRLQKYNSNWRKYYNEQDFEGMTKEIYKIRSELKTLMPMENTLKEARQIENIHNLIKNNGKNFNLTKEQLELAKVLS